MVLCLSNKTVYTEIYNTFRETSELRVEENLLGIF